MNGKILQYREHKLKPKMLYKGETDAMKKLGWKSSLPAVGGGRLHISCELCNTGFDAGNTRFDGWHIVNMNFLDGI